MRIETVLPACGLLIAMVSIQFGASRAAALFAVVGAIGTTALRLSLSALLLCAVLRPWRRPIPHAMWPNLLFYGAALGVMNMLFFLSLRGLPLGVAVALEFCGPLALTLAHMRRAADGIWIALAAGGVALLLPIGVFGRLMPAASTFGVLCALSAGACWAVYIIIGRKVGAALGTSAAAIGGGLAALLIAPFGVLTAGPALFAPDIVAAGFVVAIFSSAIPYGLEMWVLPRLPTRLFGTLLSLEPAIAALIGLAILDQHLAFRQWIGVAAVMTAATGAIWGAPGHSAQPSLCANPAEKV